MESELIENKDGAGKISIKGDLDGSTSPALQKELDDMLDINNVSALIIDLLEMDNISSSGIGVLAVASKEFSQRDGKLILVCRDKKVLNLFDITNLVKVVTIVKTFDEGLGHIK